MFCKLNKVFSGKLFKKITCDAIPKKYATIVNKRIMLKSRENPIVLKLNSPEFQGLFTNEVLSLKSIFEKYDFELRVAGGAVRDLLMGLVPHDLDFATTATPTQMKEIFTKENIRMINTNGEKHGTITPRINDKENFEITTLRIDVVTDGRRAEVQFTTDWKLDANRRDLTINSMFLGFDGSVYDYFFGYDDLRNKKVNFVGDPDTRIKEDYLRIMRYFRFYGRIAEKPDDHNEETLNVIAENVEGLQNVSGERIWTELKKTLEGNFAGELLKCMLHVGIGRYIGLPINANIKELEMVLKRSQHLRLHPISYLCTLLTTKEEVTILHFRLKLSAYERDMAYFLVEHKEDNLNGSVRSYQNLVLFQKDNIKQKITKEYLCETLKYKGEEKLLKEFTDWRIPKFPLSGKDLKNFNIPAGKSMGVVLNKLKELWVESDCTQSADNLLKHVPEILDELMENKKRKLQ